MERSGVQGNSGVAVDTTSTGLPVFGHEPFSGTYPARLEPSGRLVLPSALRSAFEGRGHVRAHRGEYLMLTTPRAFNAIVDHLSATQGVLDPRTRKRLYMTAPQVAIDKQSRLVIPPELRERVGLGEDVILAGAIESIEIWPADRFAAQEVPTHDDGDLLFDGFAGLPTDPR